MNLDLLAKAQIYYLGQGYENIPTPWFVPKEISDITLPKDIKAFSLTNGLDLVGSAEQGFLSLINDLKISSGKHQSFSPCFRDEQEDELHQKYFLKVELIDINPNEPIKSLENMIATAKSCMKYLARDKSNHIDILKINDLTYDLIFKDTNKEIELGSYGIREYKNIKWVYGTGLAEPRFSSVFKEFGI